MRKFKTKGKRLCKVLEQKCGSNLLIKLLRMLVKCSGIATTEELEEILSQIREVNDSVEIMARHIKREADKGSASATR